MWTENEVSKLKKLMQNRPFNWANISEKMGKTRSSCQGKAHRLGLTKRTYSGAGVTEIFQRWYGKIPNMVFKEKFFPKWSLPQVKIKAHRLRKKGIDLPRYKK